MSRRIDYLVDAHVIGASAASNQESAPKYSSDLEASMRLLSFLKSKHVTIELQSDGDPSYWKIHIHQNHGTLHRTLYKGYGRLPIALSLACLDLVGIKHPSLD